MTKWAKKDRKDSEIKIEENQTQEIWVLDKV